MSDEAVTTSGPRLRRIGEVMASGGYSLIESTRTGRERVLATEADDWKGRAEQAEATLTEARRIVLDVAASSNPMDYVKANAELWDLLTEDSET